MPKMTRTKKRSNTKAPSTTAKSKAAPARAKAPTKARAAAKAPSKKRAPIAKKAAKAKAAPMAPSKKRAPIAKKAAAKIKAAPKAASQIKAAPKAASKIKAAPKAASKKRIPAAKAVARGKAAPTRKVAATGKSTTANVTRRDATGHLNPQYARDLRARSEESRETEDRAFFKSSRSGDDLAEELGEEAVATMTTGEDQSDRLSNEVVDEERGGPFIKTRSQDEFARGTDRSNPRGATREPFPRT